MRRRKRRRNLLLFPDTLTEEVEVPEMLTELLPQLVSVRYALEGGA